MADLENNNTEKEIDLIGLWNVLWAKKKFILFVCLIAAIVGGIFAFSKPKQYTTRVTFVADVATSGLSGNLGMLASFAGVNMNTSSNDGIDPALYTEVLKSTAFVKDCFFIPVKDIKQGVKGNLYDYYLKHQKTSWITAVVQSPFLLLSLFSSETKEEVSPGNLDARYLSKDEMSVIGAIQASYTINMDKKTNLITFNVTAQSPTISAFLADTLTDMLQHYVIEYKVRKSQDDLDNTKYLLLETKKDYDDALLKMAEFTDRNKNVVLAQYLVKQKELQNELDLKYSIYTQMAQQVAAYQIAVQDLKPVFSIIQPAIEPLKPSAPNTKLILIGFVFLGFLGSSFWVLRKDLLDIIRG